MSRSFAAIFGIVALIAMISAGCTTADRTAPTPHGADLVPPAYQAFDGRTGDPLTFEQLAARCARADVVLFGEEHNNRVCNDLEARLLAALWRAWPLTALQMEFFESDTQAAINDYLRGRIDEPAFMERTRQGKAYESSHRPLIEFCKSRGVPVIAANAPRKLVREYRRSGQEYFRFRSSLPPTEFRWLPRQFRYLGGAYRERFMEVTKDHPPVNPPPSPGASGAKAAPPAPPMTPEQRREQGFLTQLLWDNSMSESLAGRRWLRSGERQMLIVGGFHVERDGGTVTFFRQRRPGDRTCVVLYRTSESSALAFDPADRGAADVVICGAPPVGESEAAPPAMPAPASPASEPVAPGAPQATPAVTTPAAGEQATPPGAAAAGVPALRPTSDTPPVTPGFANASETTPEGQQPPAAAESVEPDSPAGADMPAIESAPAAAAEGQPAEPAQADRPADPPATEAANGQPAEMPPVQPAAAEAAPQPASAPAEQPPAEQPAPTEPSPPTSQPVPPYLREKSKDTPTTKPAANPPGR